jgi:hypothetical protein
MTLLTKSKALGEVMIKKQYPFVETPKPVNEMTQDELTYFLNKRFPDGKIVPDYIVTEWTIPWWAISLGLLVFLLIVL